MEQNKTGRRNFVRSSVIGLGALSFNAALAASSPDNTHGQEKLNILCVGAHPGDPEFGCGGTMATYSNAGHAVTFLYLTRGEAYNNDQSFEKSAALRTAEATASCKILHATPLFAGQTDGDTILNKQSAEAFTKIILAQKPHVVFTHWPVDTHQDHQVAGMLTLTAWMRAQKSFHLYFYEVNAGSETMSFKPTDYVDITAVRAIKKSALLAHKTQQPREVYDTFFQPMETFRGLEAGVAAAEAFIYFAPRSGGNNMIRP